MNFGRGFLVPQENDIQITGSWMPVTPEKPILQRSNPIPVDRQGNQVGRENWQDLIGMYEGILQDTTTNYDEAVPNFNSIEQMGENGIFCNRVVGVPSDSYNQNFRTDSADWNSSPLAELLAINNAASVVASANRTPNRSIHVANGPPIWRSCSQVDSNWTEPNSASLLRTSQVHACGPNQWNINGDILLQLRDGFPVPYHRNLNLNSPPRSEADAASSVTNSFQFAPETPDQVKQFENRRGSEMLNFSIDESSSQEKEKDKQENIFTSFGSEAIDNHSDNLLQIIVDSSSAAISTPLKEKNSSDQGGDQHIDLNETPQQKPPKRRKHRPKVIVEGKPKRTPRMTTPKNNNSMDTPSGKRKYERKTGPKAPATRLPDVTNEVAVPNVGSDRKSCRRALNFDLENGTRDEGQEKATSHQAEMQQENRVAFNLNLASQATDFCTRINNSNENPSGKRNNVCKNSRKEPPTQSPDVTNDVAVANVGSEGKSCRRVSNFDFENGTRNEGHKKATSNQAETQQENRAAFNLNLDSQDTDLCTRLNNRSQTKSTIQMQQQNGYVMENQQAEITCNLNCSMNQMPAGYMPLPEICVPAAPSAATKNHALNVIARNVSMKNFTVNQTGGKNGYSQVHHHIHGKELSEGVIQGKDLERTRQLMSQNSPQMAVFNVANSDEKRGSKRAYCHNAEQTHPYTKILMGSPLLCKGTYLIDNNNSNSSNFSTGCPETNKKKRSENGYHATRSSTPCITAVKDCSGQVVASRNGTCTNSFTPEINSRILDSYFENNNSKKLNNGVNGTAGDWYTDSIAAEHNFQKRLTSSELHSHTERKAENRSYSSTQVHDLTSLTTVTKWNLLSSNPSERAPAFDHMQESEALHANMSAKQHVVEVTSSKLVSSTANKVRLQENKDAFHGNHQFSMTVRGPPKKRKNPITIDEIIYQLEGLNINGKCNVLVGQEQKALVLYKSGGTIVPYEGLDPIKKRKPRPKVDLDPETNRIWKLLMGKEGSEGVKAEDKEKWWEEEREVFRGRADSFIARMHLVQGDRRFSQWKGSVVDSVIGVFLTQNVSDHLSSSAFMSLAAKFPFRLTTTNQTSYESGTSMLADVTKGGILDNRGTISNLEKIVRQPYHNHSSVTSCESSQYRTDNLTTGTGLANGQNNSGSNREIRFNSGSNSEVEDPTIGSKSSTTHSSTPVNPLHVKNNAGFQQFYSHGVGSSFLYDRSKQGNKQSEDTEYNNQIPRSSSVFTHPIKSDIPNMQGPFVPSSNFQLHMRPDSGVLEADYFGVLDEQSISSLPSTASGIIWENGGEHMSKRIGHMAESTYSVQQNAVPRVQEAAFLSKYSMHQERNLEPAPHTARDQLSINTQQQEMFRAFQVESTLVNEPIKPAEALSEKQTGIRQQVPNDPKFTGQTFGMEERIFIANKQKHLVNKAVEADTREQVDSSGEAFSGTSTNISNMKKAKAEGDKRKLFDWDSLRKHVQPNGRRKDRSKDAMDSLDYEAVLRADVSEISNAIKERGMNNMLAERIQDFLDRLVREHGSIDLEWLRDVPPDKAKDYLLSIRGLGLKSVECVRLLTLHHLAFPVDTNVGRIAVRLGWVPLQPLPESLQLHLLELYPMLESIQKYLWPRLCKLDQRTLYELHYQMITFGKVFCTKNKPNCNACPMRGDCRHFASAFASARLALPGPEERNIVSSNIPMPADKYPTVTIKPPMPLPPAENNASKEAGFITSKCEPIVEEPTTPEPESREVSESDIEDAFYEDPDEIPTIRLNLEEFTLNLHNYMQENNMELQEGDMSKALVALNPEAACIPTPKLKNVSRLRTEHQVYELPDSHPLLEGVDRREPDDPSPYLLAIWTPGETANSTQPPERCGSQESGRLCNEETCFSCNNIRETNSQSVRGTILIPCRTAMRGSFPLNGTYFQVNEVFADHESSLNPINVPRALIWNLPRRMVYFGTSVSTIFKGLSTEGIQYCFWRGFVCVRGFDQKTRAPRPLMARLHFPASRLTKTKNEAKK